MELKTQKRLAANILKCSKKRIWLDPNRLDEIKEAITKFDIKNLIRDEAIKVKRKKGISKFRARKKKEQKRKGRQKGFGSRKGKRTARLSKKDAWKNSIRVQRRYLKEIKAEGAIERKVYRNLYLKSKGGFFRSKRHIKLYIEDHGLIKK